MPHLPNLKQPGFRHTVVAMLAGGALFAAGMTWKSEQTAHALPPHAAADELSAAFRAVANEAVPSVVSIETRTKARRVELQGRGGSPFDDENNPLRQFFGDDPRFRDMFRQPQQRMIPEQQGMGSGFIIDASGLIMTNSHVVNGADEVLVRLSDGREFVGEDIKTDPRTDVAIIRIKGDSNLKPIRLGDSHGTEVGDWVMAVGNPFGLELSVTAGIISGKGRGRHIAEREEFLQTDAAINPGNSGGPLLNLRGEVIGINTAIASRSGGYDGIGFAIPIHLAQWVGDQLAKDGKVKRAYLGVVISQVNADVAKQAKVNVREGAFVREVRRDGPADKAGVEPGDVILTLDGKKVVDTQNLQGIVERLEIGKEYPLVVSRDGKQQTLSVSVEEMPGEYTLAAREGSEQAPSRVDAVESLGITVTPLTPQLAGQLGVQITEGLVVTAVDDSGLAGRAGVSVGDVIDRVGSTPVKTLDDLTAAVKAEDLKQGLVLHLRSKDGKRIAILKGNRD